MGGGKDPCVVCSDADLDLAASNIVKGGFSYSGQRCTAVKIVLACEDIADITAVINRKSADYIESLVKDAEAKGATLTSPYTRVGNLIHPLLVDNVTEDMKLCWEEPFGPVIPFVRVANADAAVELANKSELGLQGCVFTQDINKALAIANE